MPQILFARHGSRSIIILCIVAFSVGYCLSLKVSENKKYAETETNTTETTAVEETVTIISENNLSIEPCIVYNITDKKVEYANRIYEKHSPASLAKLLTSLVVMRYVNTDTVFKVGTEQELVEPGSSLCLISRGQRLKVIDLLSGMLISSGNDAAYTLAVNTAKAINPNLSDDGECVSYFTELMNEYCENTGMKDSRFFNPDGFDFDGQYSTVFDLLLLAENFLQNDSLREIAKTGSRYTVFESGENITWCNTNEMLDPESAYYNPCCIGMKTGTTADAGYNLISAFEKENEYIIIVLGCSSDGRRYKLTGELFNQYCK